jgi:XTP/dITP diphosphohydrolase
MTEHHDGLRRLIATMATLRGKDGCPWDGEQTHQSLVPYLLEEVYELIEAIESGSRDDLLEELGDVLYQVLFHADIAASEPDFGFDIDDVAATVETKMRARHPHVFADGDARSVAEVTARWEEIKAEEKSHRTSAMEGIPERLSALARASSVLKRSRDALDVSATNDLPAISTEEELGQLLLDVVALAREQGLNPETALRSATRVLEQRVRDAEASQLGLAPGDSHA